jgi:isopropylmalate/homocitrate/citramalate synthase
MGYELSGDELNRFYQEFVRLADSKKHVYDQDLLSILAAQRAEIPAS